jgi:hypothetical protein
MTANIFTLIFACSMLWLLHRYAVPQIHSVASRRATLIAHGFLSLVLLVNALFAFLGRGGLLLVAELPTTTTLQEVQHAGLGDTLVVVGRVSPQNDTLFREYVAYVEDYLRSPRLLWVDLEDGAVAITNDTYAQRNWPIAEDASTSITYLPAYHPIVVTGYVERDTAVAGRSVGGPTLRAELVYAGGYENFIAQARQRLIIPTVLLVLNLATVLGGVILAVLAWRRIAKQIEAHG